MRALLVAELVWLGLFFTTWAPIGSGVVACEGALLPYCATAELVGYVPAWLLWHALVSLALGWALVALARARA